MGKRDKRRRRQKKQQKHEANMQRGLTPFDQQPPSPRPSQEPQPQKAV